VKFAKYQPLPDDNSQSLNNAYQFVNMSKKEEALRPELKLEDFESKKSEEKSVNE